MEQAAERIVQMAGEAQPSARLVAPVNAQLVNTASQDSRFANLLSGIDLVVADGMSLIHASRLLGCPLPERVPGVDLMVRVCERAAQQDLRIYFLGGKVGSAAKAAGMFVAKYPELKIVGIDCPPLGFDSNPSLTDEVIRQIRNAAPDLLFVGFGSPKQEYWMREFASQLPVKVMMAVGGSFDLLAGDPRRAPRWMQEASLEWLFRLLLEPRRLWKRYLLGNPRFALIVFQQFLRGREAQ
jgi:N-acetylglucosaminyldiphosphoundecaprenol N-acetyl-beta-D-mannosaminyltransferase